MKNYFKILGVERTATDSEIKTAYRRLAQRYHPDKFVNPSVDVHSKIVEINQAYSVLGDAVKKKEYSILLSIMIGERSSAIRMYKDIQSMT